MIRDESADDELAELATWAEARLPRLADGVCAATVARIPFYRDEKVVPTEELRRSIEQNLRFLVTAIRDPQAPLDLAAPEQTGRQRAHQGAPLPEVLQCYRICFTTLWDALVEHTRTTDRPAATDALLTAASMILRLTDHHAVALTEAYRAATAELLLARQQRRSALVEALLTGHPSPPVCGRAGTRPASTDTRGRRPRRRHPCRSRSTAARGRRLRAGRRPVPARRADGVEPARDVDARHEIDWPPEQSGRPAVARPDRGCHGGIHAD